MVAVSQHFHRMAKAEKTGLSLPTDLREDAQERANLSHRGNFSAYVQDPIRSDLANTPLNSAVDSNVLTELARIYAGYLAPGLGSQLAERKSNQPGLLHRLLNLLSEHFARGGSDTDLVIIGSRLTSYHELPDAFRKQSPDSADLDEMANFARERVSAADPPSGKGKVKAGVPVRKPGPADADRPASGPQATPGSPRPITPLSGSAQQSTG